MGQGFRLRNSSEPAKTQPPLQVYPIGPWGNPPLRSLGPAGGGGKLQAGQPQPCPPQDYLQTSPPIFGIGGLGILLS